MILRLSHLLVAAIAVGIVAGEFNYSICENATCIGVPNDCLATLNCQAVCKVDRISSDVYRFVVETIPPLGEKAPPPIYVALSLDSHNQNDSLVKCVSVNNQTEVLIADMEQSPSGVGRHTLVDEIRITERSNIGGSIRCAFKWNPITVTDDQIFDWNGMPRNLRLTVATEVNADLIQMQTMRVAPPEPEIASKSITNRNIEYNVCGKTQTCFGIPDGCVSKMNCHTIISITYTSPTYKFQLATNSGIAYVAIGLSTDNKMGSDSVIECVRENDVVNMYTSYTRNDHSGTDRHLSNGLATLLDSSYANGQIYCHVERNETGVVSGQEFNLLNQKFYVLLAIGDAATATSVTVHKQKQVSSRAIYLAVVTDLSEAAKPLLIKLHGCLMIVAWMGTAALGLVLARFFKTEWPNATLFRKDLWFIFHVSCMITTWTLTLIAFVVIFVHVGGWTKIASTHAIVGLIVTILCFFHPILAIFRPPPTHPTRYRFNIGHYFGGRVAFLLAIINIYYSTFVKSAEMPLWFLAILVIFTVVFWGNHILMGTMAYLADSKRSLVRAFVGPAKRIDYATADYNAWYVRLKMRFLVLYLIAIIALVVSGVCVVVFYRSS